MRVPPSIVASFLLALPCSGALVVVDFNDLNTGNLQNQGGGVGLSDIWGDTGTINVIAGSMVAPASTNFGIAESGTAKYIQGGHTEYRQSSRPLATALQGTIWFSFLAEVSSATSNVGITFDVNGFSSGLPRVALVGDTLNAGLTSLTATSSSVAFNTTALIVGRLITDPSGGETLDVWLNPDVSGGIAGLGTAAGTYSGEVTALNDGVNRIAVSTYRAATGTGGRMDALRLSDAVDPNQAFADVTTIPEPSAFLSGLVGLALVCRRKR